MPASRAPPAPSTSSSRTRRRCSQRYGERACVRRRPAGHHDARPEAAARGRGRGRGEPAGHRLQPRRGARVDRQRDGRGARDGRAAGTGTTSQGEPARPCPWRAAGARRARRSSRSPWLPRSARVTTCRASTGRARRRSTIADPAVLESRRSLAPGERGRRLGRHGHLYGATVNSVNTIYRAARIGARRSGRPTWSTWRTLWASSPSSPPCARSRWVSVRSTRSR